MKDSTARYVSFIKAAGYRVFMRRPSTDEYCYYTDGARIGYAEWTGYRGPCVSSVHVPNRTTGTGFSVADEITAESLRDAISCHAPDWATARERNSVRKYPSWTAFHGQDAWHAQLVEV